MENPNKKLNNTRFSSCPCGGGQSCIVDRRNFGDFVIIDDVMKKAGLPLFINCYDSGTPAQKNAWNNYMKAFQQSGYDSVVIK